MGLAVVFCQDGRMDYSKEWAGASADWYQGIIFNPAVYLGVVESSGYLPVRLVSPSQSSIDIPIDGEPTLEWHSGTNPNIIEHVLCFITDETHLTRAMRQSECFSDSNENHV